MGISFVVSSSLRTLITSGPERPGISQSSMMRSGLDSWIASRAAAPELSVSTLYFLPSQSESPVRQVSSSSTTNILFLEKVSIPVITFFTKLFVSRGFKNIPEMEESATYERIVWISAFVPTRNRSLFFPSHISASFFRISVSLYWYSPRQSMKTPVLLSYFFMESLSGSISFTERS